MARILIAEDEEALRALTARALADSGHDVVTAIDGKDASWHVTDRSALSTVLPLWNSGQTASVQFVFDPEDFGGAWTIDDVYVDPYTRG